MCTDAYNEDESYKCWAVDSARSVMVSYAKELKYLPQFSLYLCDKCTAMLRARFLCAFVNGSPSTKERS